VFHTFAALVALASINAPVPILDDAWDPRAQEEDAPAEVSVDRAQAQSIVLAIEVYAATRATFEHATEHAALLVTLTIRPEAWLWTASAPTPMPEDADVDLEDPSREGAWFAARSLCGCSTRGFAP
jgi:hypothetical protein